MKKTCYRCKIEQSETEYTKEPKRADGLASRCRTCQRSVSNQWYLKNKKRQFAYAQERRSVLHDYVISYFKTHCCVDCGTDDILVLEFDHVRDTKKSGINRLIHNGGNLQALISEIDKCEVRCANCHRRRHVFCRKNDWKLKYLENVNDDIRNY